MSETKDFKFEATKPIFANEASAKKIEEFTEVVDVEFLTPARIKLKSKHGKEISVMVSVDILNRKVYGNDGELLLSNEVFAHLDEAVINKLPDDFFVAPDDVREQAAQSTVDHRQFIKDIVESNE